MDIFSSLIGFFQDLGSNIQYNVIAISGLCALIFVIAYSLLRTSFTYEVKLLRNVSKLNRYFIKNPYVNDENIVELNERMKNVPRTLRYCWQEYMLNRDKAPSEYMNTTVCVDQPSKTSAYANTATTASTFTIIISIITFLLGVAKMAYDENIRFNTFLYEAMLIPLLVLTLGFLFVAFLRARHTSVISDLYYSFHEFERNMNKACTTMPAFIDYEVLFTKKEIKEGIPVLQDYLEKRRIQENREREEAELNASQFEYYDFDELGVENALLLERAMKESEKYINVKRDLSTKVLSKETEMYNYQKNFDEVTKEFERKAQATRESLSQLAEQINQTTIKIEANYMKKRHNEEQTRLQQLEKDYELATSRFQKQQEEMQAEIDALNKDITRRKTSTEDAMKAECKNYANKIYGQISSTVQEQSKPYIDQISEDKINLESTINELKQNLAEKNEELNKSTNELELVREEYRVKIAEIKAIKDLKTYLTSPEFKQGFLSKKEIKQLNDGRSVNVSSDVVKQIADLEERVKLADKNAILYQDKITLLERGLQSANKEADQAKRVSGEMVEKAKSTKIAEQKAIEVTTVSPGELLRKSIENIDSKGTKAEKPQPKSTVSISTVKTVVSSPEPKVEEKAEDNKAKKDMNIISNQKGIDSSSISISSGRKKASLDSLLTAVNKIQQKNLENKTLSKQAKSDKEADKAEKETDKADKKED